MIAQPTSITPPPPANLEQEVVLLRAALNDALVRIGNLEQRVSGNHQDGSGPTSAGDDAKSACRSLIPLDSPAMAAALALCADVFPGCRTKTEVLTDPDDPDRSWWLITVYWQSTVRHAIDQQSVWQNRFDAIHPEVTHDISLFVVPE